ncbi:MAG: signal peptidase II [Candidatus Fimenecus sp.]
MTGIITTALIAILITLDRLFKYFAVKSLSVKGSVTVIKGILSFSYVENTGAAFGLFKNSKLVLIVFTLALLIGLFYVLYFKKLDNKFLHYNVAIITAGGMGNLVDRIIKGYVVDYIKTDFISFPVFNFADICVTVGAFCLIIFMIYEIYILRKNETECIENLEKSIDDKK